MHEKVQRYVVVRDTTDTYASPLDAVDGTPPSDPTGAYDFDNVHTYRRLCLCPVSPSGNKDMIPSLTQDGLMVDVDCPATVGDILNITVSWE